MNINIPEAMVEQVKRDCGRTNLPGCRFVARMIEKLQQDEAAVHALMLTASYVDVDKQALLKSASELEQLVQPGFQRFRLLQLIVELEGE